MRYKEEAPIPNKRNLNPDGIELSLTGDRNQCRVCTEYFNSTHAFDKHRRNGKCLTRAEMTRRGMTMINGGYWVGAVMDSNALELRSRVRQAGEEEPLRSNA